MTIHRRGFLAGILAAGVAPAFVGAKVLMPVKQIVTPFSICASLADALETQLIIDSSNEYWNAGPSYLPGDVIENAEYAHWGNPRGILYAGDSIAEIFRKHEPLIRANVARDNIFLKKMLHR